jgi:light-regulated signal transduction histidine kinase (bacteriophytochrome)
MGNLIDDLLAFSRIGRAETRKTSVNLAQLVREAVAELGQDMGGREIVWKIGPLPVCYGDRSMLRLVVVNLLSNAVKFTRLRSRAEIEIGSTAPKDDQIEVFVRDNGAGFEMQYVNKLFGVFQRLHRTEEFEGTGIGLATVQRIIHRHGGKVRAEGGVDRGATFYFSLPGA